MSRLTSWLTAMCFVAAVAAPAWAQDGDKPTGDDTSENEQGDTADKPPPPPPPTTTNPTPTPAPKPTPEPKPTTAPVTPKADNDDGDAPGGRPQAKSLGFGFGYVFPADVQLVNTASARIVWSDSLIIEPIAELSFSSDTTDVGGMDSTDSTTVFNLGAELRYQLWSRWRAGLSFVGGAGVGFTKDNPDGNDNNTTTISFGVNWGLGLDLWLWKRWGLSFTLTNPLFRYSQSSQQQAIGGDIKNSSTFFGLVWDDSAVRFMLHAYF